MSPCNIDLAKNLVLAGVSLTIFDDEKVTKEDFEDNPIIIELDIGKNVPFKISFNNLSLREVKS